MKIYEAKIQYNVVRELSAPLQKIQLSDDIVEYMQGAFDEYPFQESLWIVGVNNKNVPLFREMVSLGSLSSTICTPKEVFRLAILSGCAAIALVHNHPSGDPTPSKADIDMTKRIKQYGEIMGIQLLDHIIIGEKIEDPRGIGYFSFLDNSIMH